MPTWATPEGPGAQRGRLLLAGARACSPGASARHLPSVTWGPLLLGAAPSAQAPSEGLGRHMGPFPAKSGNTILLF